MGDQFSEESFATVISAAVESIYYLKNKNFVGALAFAKPLVLHTKTGTLFSKLLHILYLNMFLIYTYMLYISVISSLANRTCILWIFIGNKEGLNVVSAACSFGSYNSNQFLSCWKSTGRREFDVLKRATLYR